MTLCCTDSCGEGRLKKGGRTSSQEMDMATPVQNLDEGDCISYRANNLGKGTNPIILP